MRKRKSKARPAAPPPVPVTPSSPRGDAFALSSLLLLQLAFWWRAALLRGFLLTSDICYFFEPMKSLLHERLRQGHLALWSPYLQAGYPVAAEGQIATFYPPSLLCSWLFDGGGAVNWLLISHLVLAGVGLYLLARRLGVSPFGAWLGGVVFSFCGFFFAHLHHVSLICAAAWLPLLVLFADRAWHRLLPWAPLAALVWGAAALTGHPQTLFYSSLLVFFWVAWQTVQDWRATRRWRVRPALTLLATTFLLGLGVGMVQLLLTRDLSAVSPHGDRGSLYYVTSYSLLGKHLIGLLAPNFQGSPAFASYHGEKYYWEYVLYLGILPFLLALVGAGTRRGWTLAGLAAGSLILAMAEGNPLYEVLRYLPGFADFRAEARFIFPFTFAASLLVSVGWDQTTRWLGGSRRAVWAVASGVALLSAADLWHFDRPLAALTAPNWYHHPHPIVEQLEADHDWWRAVVRPPVAADAEWTPPGGWARNPDGWAESRYLLGADAAQSYDLRITDGYVTFSDSDQAKYMQVANTLLMVNQVARLYSLLGVRYLLMPPTYEMPGLERLSQVRAFAVFRNPETLPRAFGVGDVTVCRNRAAGRQRAFDLAADDAFSRAAAVFGSLGTVRPVPGANVIVARIQELRPERVRVVARADRDAVLILNERWDRGWLVSVDGRTSPALEVDGVLMGAPLPAGEHTVEFLYAPRGLRIGLPVTLAAAGACVLLALLPSVRRRVGRGPAASAV